LFASSLVCVVHTNNEGVASINANRFRMLGNIIFEMFFAHLSLSVDYVLECLALFGPVAEYLAEDESDEIADYAHADDE